MVKRAKSAKRTKAAKAVAPASGGAHPLSQNHLKTWRLFRGITSQEELAKRTGIPRPTISRLESGALRYRQEVLEKIATVLDCAPHDLISVDPNDTITVMMVYKRLNERDRKRAVKMLQGLAEEA